MPNVEVHEALDPPVEAGVRRLLAAVERVTGRPALSDHLALDLARGGSAGFLAATAADDGEIVGYAQASAANESHLVELVLEPRRADDIGTTGRELLGAILTGLGDRGGGAITWMVSDPTPPAVAVAGALGLAASRTLLQMRRPLPTGMTVTVETRAIVVGADDAGFLDVNNRAFAGHGEQGGWTFDTLRRRQAEPWFDPADVRIHERDGRIVAFCWTKVHPPTTADPQLGEIYVIAVDPDHHGRGLGRQMTLAGLDHLARKGITTGMLWVDADNAAARTLYEQLGFTVHATTVAFAG